MRVFKRIILIITTFLLLVILGTVIYLNSIKPQYSGTISISGIQHETSVYFDDFGIPHIYAENEKDAFRSLGYIHAQDRLWQMELMKRIAPGELSEIFGEKALKNDLFFASIGIEEASEKAMANVDKSSDLYLNALAYIDGVNQFIEHGETPIEFTLIGIKKEPYELKDVYNILGYMAFSFAMAQKTDPLLTAIQNKLGSNYLEDLSVHVNPNSTLIKNFKTNNEALIAMTSAIHDVMNASPIPPFEGSNSWVIASDKTKAGKVIFANDPHIAYSQPGTWYEAHMVTPSYEMYGYHIAGVPFPLLGHNRNYAYGLTMFENDDIDFYIEKTNPQNPNEYLTKNGFKTFKTSTKSIAVKGKDPIELKVKSSDHGPVLNDVINGLDSSEPVAMSWVYTMFDVEILEALYQISTAESMRDVKSGASKIHAPGLNVMYGDNEGNIAWWAAGKLYKHQSHVNTKLILDGSTGEDDPVEYLDFDQNPMAENPDWKYVYSANNQPDSIAGIVYPGYYLPEDRAKRIVELLEPKNNWTRQSVATMINDVTSATAPDIIKEFTEIMDYNSFSKKEQNAIDILQLWDGSNTVDNSAPTIYNKWIYCYLKNTFKDEMGDTIFNHLLNTHLMKRTIGDHIKNDTSIWWDDVETPDKKESKKEILSVSLKETVSALEDQLGAEMRNWSWGKVHTLEHKHPIGEAVKMLRSRFNVGPFPIKGAREVIDNRGFHYNDSGYYIVNSGPSTRRIVDFSDIENSISILPTGQSGNPFSQFYSDQADLYNKGNFRKMKMNKEEIIKVSTKLTIISKDE